MGDNRESAVRTLEERVRWARAMITSADHLTQRGEERLRELQDEIQRLEKKRGDLVRDIAAAPEMRRRGEEELDKCQRLVRARETRDYDRAPTRSRLERILEKREAARARLAELERELKAIGAWDETNPVDRRSDLEKAGDR